MSNPPTPSETDNDCRCDPAQINWHPENGWSDEHQHIIPGTCTGCGEERLYVYNEAGIKDADTRKYLHEF